jgi:hypothetical protein
LQQEDAAMKPEFDYPAFVCTTPDEWLARCRTMAEEAAHLASAATGEEKAAYLNLAKEWSALADELEAANR